MSVFDIVTPQFTSAVYCGLAVCIAQSPIEVPAKALGPSSGPELI